MGNYAAGVHGAFKGHQPTKAQFAMAMSFHWNTGEIETAAWVIPNQHTGDRYRRRKNENTE